MIKFFVPYKTNEKPISSEQAAGFPPFTRGYSCLSINIQLINNILYKNGLWIKYA